MLAIGTTDSGGSSAGVRPGGTTTGYRTPYTVTANSSLSEDHFLVRPGKFDASRDKVVTYVHDDTGALEAMVVQAGVLSQLYHDASRDGAWALAPVKVGATDLVGVIDVVAGRPLDSADKVGALHVFCRTATTVLHLVQSADRSWTSTDLGWNPSPDGSSLPPKTLTAASLFTGSLKEPEESTSTTLSCISAWSIAARRVKRAAPARPPAWPLWCAA